MARALFFLVLVCVFSSAVCYESGGGLKAPSCPSEESLLTEFDNSAAAYDSSASWSRCRGEESWLGKQNVVLSTSCHSLYTVCTNVMMSLQLISVDCYNTLINNSNGSDPDTVSATEAYGYGFIMIVGVALLSLVGIVLVPLVNTNLRLGQITYRYVLTLLIAMGVSALLCNALFELIPIVFHVGHDHTGEHLSDTDESSHDEQEHIWKACGIFAGILVFYLFELLLHYLIDTASDTPPSQNDLNHKDTDKKPLMRDSGDGGKTREQSPAIYEEGCCQKFFSLRRVRPLAWIILTGDLLHNIADGITLGAAVSQSLTLGVSTMIAIILHEIPHELADFGILVKSGLHWFTALLFNFLSSLTAILGFFVGVAISTNSSAAKEWLLAVAAGSFLYIALADLLPELKIGHSHDPSFSDGSRPRPHGHKRPSFSEKVIHCFVIIGGFTIAFVILLVVSLHEEKLNELF